MASDEANPERPAETNHEKPMEKSNNGMPFEQSSAGSQLVQRVRALTEALEGSDISELELNEDGARILIRRQLEAPMVSPRSHGAARSAPARRMPSASGERTGEGATSGPQDAGSSRQGIAVVAPLTGVYYGSSSPSAPAFVSVGDTVQAGQVVCLVEAMKVFNEIKAEISGTVAAIVAQSGQLVHKGAPLIRIQPI